MLKIVWDWNGTLFDDVELCFEDLRNLQIKYGLKPLENLQAYRNIFGFPVRNHYEQIGFDFNRYSWPDVAGEYMDYYTPRSKSCSLMPGALQALEKISDLKGASFILSASQRVNLVEQLLWFPRLESYLSGVYGIEDIYAHSKKELARSFMETIMPWDLVIFVGDTLHDAEIAAELKAKCILLSTGHQSRERLEHAGFPVAKNMEEAERIIEDLWKKHLEEIHVQEQEEKRSIMKMHN